MLISSLLVDNKRLVEQDLDSFKTIKSEALDGAAYMKEQRLSMVSTG
jgi:hypothetical protein